MGKKSIVRFILACTIIAYSMTIATSYAAANTYQNYQKPLTAFYSESKEKWGFRDSNGNVIIKPKYQYAENFSHYGAIVKIRNKYGVINAADDYLIAAKYELIEHGSYRVYIVTYGGKKGLITILNSSTTRETVPCKYDDIQYNTTCDVYIVTKDAYKGLILEEGNEIITCKYDDINILNQGHYFVTLGGKCGMYKNNAMIMECKYDEIRVNTDYYLVTNNQKQGICDLSGREVIGCNYDEITVSSKFILAKQGNECIVYGYSDKKEVNRFTFDSITQINDDFLIAKDGKYGLITDSNYANTPKLYDSIEWHNTNVYIVTRDKKYGILTDGGEELIAPVLNQLDTTRLGREWQLCYSNGLYYMVSHNGMLTLHQYERNYNYPWDQGYHTNTQDYHKVPFDNVISAIKFEYANGYYEENIGANTYTHTKAYKTMSVGGFRINVIQHQIDRQYYIYIEKDNVIKRKISNYELTEIAKLGTERNFSMTSVQLLSNGDILLETENSVGYNDPHAGATTYVNVHGEFKRVDDYSYTDYITNTMKYVFVIDGKNYRLKHCIVLPQESSIIGISNYDGWYVANNNDIFFASSSFPISKFSNKCEFVWSYTPSEGIGFGSICETSESLYLGGYTKNNGYIGKFNPYVCRLDRVNGAKKADKFYKIANQNYSVVKLEDGKSKIAPIYEQYYYYGNYYDSREVQDGYFSDIEPLRIEAKQSVHNNIYAYGLVNQYDEWVVKPVLPGESPVKYGDWVVSPCNVYVDNNNNLRVSHGTTITHKGNKVVPVLSHDYDELDDFDIVIEEKEEEIEEEEIFVTVDEMPTFQGGGLPEFRNWVQSHVKYPQIALENGIQGNVVVQFVVDTNGRLINFKILQSPDKTLSDATIAALEEANKLGKKGWKPGKQHGKTVKVSFTLPVRFTIQN